MRKLIMKMSVTLDGFVSSASGENDWIFKTGDEQSLAWSAGEATKAGLIIMGRKSFEMMAPYWPTASGPFAAPMNEIPKAVFTRKGYAGIPVKAGQSPSADSWSNARIFTGDLAKEIKALKEESGKPIVAIGGGGFMQSLIATGLVDEYVLATHPVALGTGLPIFSGLAAPLYLKLQEVESFPGGGMAKTYTV